MICEHCGDVIGTSKEGDVIEGLCNWCNAFLENDGSSHGSSEYDDYAWTDEYYEEVTN